MESQGAGLSDQWVGPFSGKQHKAKASGEHVPRLAQLARAPDCRLETHGCRQPSGGPRFKSGSADQKIIIHSVDGCIRSILGGSVRIVYSAICVEILDFNRCR